MRDRAERLIVESVDSVLRSSLAESVACTVLRSPLVDVVAPEIERIVNAVLEGPAARRLVAHAMDSGVVDEVVARLLEREELWVFVDEVARSPAVTEAISHQGAGFVDQVAGAVRDRSSNADARLERVARRLVRRNTPPRPATQP